MGRWWLFSVQRSLNCMDKPHTEFQLSKSFRRGDPTPHDPFFFAEIWKRYLIPQNVPAISQILLQPISVDMRFRNQESGFRSTKLKLISRQTRYPRLVAALKARYGLLYNVSPRQIVSIVFKVELHTILDDFLFTLAFT